MRPGRRSAGSGSTGGGCRAARQTPQLAVQYGRDGYLLLEAAARPAPRGGAGPARGGGGAAAGCSSTPATSRAVIRREAGPDGQGLPPGRLRIISLDTDARFAQARHGLGRVQDPPHRTAPASRSMNLITSVATTAAPVPDAVITTPVHDMLPPPGSPPRARRRRRYISAQLLLDAAARGITLTGPLPPYLTQAQASGYTTDMSPSTGTTSRSPAPGHPKRPLEPGSAARHRGDRGPVHGRLPACPPAASAPAQRGAAATISAAPADPRRDRGRPRRTATRQWKDRYAIRAGVEGTIRQATHVTASAPPATSACARPAWNTPSPPQPST